MSRRLQSPSSLSGVALVVCAMALAGCSSSGKAAKPGSSAAAKASSTPSAAPRHVLVATYADNGGTLTVLPQDQIRVVLAGMAWTYEATSHPDIVKQAGKATTLPRSSGCVAGQGCGSVTAYFHALKVGTSDIRASRANCDGAAKSCVTGAGAFRLKIVVRAN